jgi:hypothetical protein
MNTHAVMENSSNPAPVATNPAPNLTSEEGNGFFNNALAEGDDQENNQSEEEEDDDSTGTDTANGGTVPEDEEAEDAFDEGREINDIAYVNESLGLGIKNIPKGLRVRDLFIHTIQDVNQYWQQKMSEFVSPANEFVAGLNQFIADGGTEAEFLTEFIKANRLGDQPQTFTAEQLRASYKQRLTTEEGYSDTEAEEEMELLQNAGTLQRKLDALAKKMKAEQPPVEPAAILKSLADGRKQVDTDEDTKFHQFMSGLQQSAAQFKTFKEIPVENQQVSDAIAFATQRNPTSGNTYLEDAMRAPELVIRIAMELLYGDEYTNLKVNKAFEDGKSHLRDKYSDNPVINTKKQNKGGVDVATLRSYD